MPTDPLSGSSLTRPHPWLGGIVFGLDGWLRERRSVTEYTHDRRCILRVQIGRLDQDVALADGTSARAGERVVDLHLWNEQIPPMPSCGASIAWARQMHVCFRHSLQELARYLAARPGFDDIGVLRADMTLGAPEQHRQMVRLMSRYGFEPVAAATTATVRERVHRLGENVLISLMVLANGAALRSDILRRGRTQVLMSRPALERRYGAGINRIDRT